MDSNSFLVSPTVSIRRRAERSSQASGTPVIAEMKARQASKIRELGHVLVDVGFLTLDEQSKALGLARSTTWTILRASHKGSGPLGRDHQTHVVVATASSARPMENS